MVHDFFDLISGKNLIITCEDAKIFLYSKAVPF